MKKLLAVLFVFIMLFSTAAFPASATSFADTEGKSCETAVEVLAALGIVEGKAEGAYEPDSSLTRAEMATIVLRTMNMAETTEGRNIFTDVSSSHWAYKNIAAAHQLGIINGTSETTFEPDKTVTYEQAVKMVVAALGYTVQAEAGGGYPAGYLLKAAQLDLLKGVLMEKDMTRGNMAVLLYNALDAELFLQSTFGDGAYDFETDETKTLLSYYLKVKKMVGTVEATYAASAVSRAPKLLSDEVRIGGVTMKAGETDAQNMLGVRADVYTREDEITEKPVILAIAPRSSVKTENIAGRDIEPFDGRTLSYTDSDGREKKADLSGAILVYNGRVSKKDDAHIRPGVGTVRLISDGGEYTHVIIEAYKNYAVDKTVAEDDTVYFKKIKEQPSPMVIVPSDNSSITILTDASGNPITIADLAEWDILSVAESEGETDKVRRIYRSAKVIEGKITELGTNEVVINDTAYPFDSVLSGILKVGKTAGFYLDYAGAVAAVDENYKSGGTYGWLVSAANTKGLGAKAQLKVFTEDGEMKVFDAADTVQVNGSGVKNTALLEPGEYSGNDVWNANDAGERTPLTNKEGETVAQLIRFETNDSGILTSIETAWNYSDPNMDYALKYGNDFSMDWYYHTAAYVGSRSGSDVNDEEDLNNAARFNGVAKGDDTHQYQGKIENLQGIFLGHIGADEKTKLFIIPAAGASDKDYSIRPLDEFDQDAVRASKYVSFYDVDESYHCGAMVMHNYLEASDKSGGSAANDVYPNANVSPALITGISKTLSEDGEVENTLKLVTLKGVETSVTVEDGQYALFANTASDIVADTAWYTKDDKNERKELSLKEREAFRARWSKSEGVKRMYIDVADLVPGDVIQYEADSTGKLTRANVLFRSEYAIHIELYQASSHQITPTSKVLNYMSGGRVMTNGKVIKTAGFGTTLEVHPVDASGVPQLGITYVRSLPTSGKFVLWDTKNKTARMITAADIQFNDEIYSYWQNINQLLTVVYR